VRANLQNADGIIQRRVKKKELSREMISVLREDATLNYCALDSSKTVNLEADNESNAA